ncbi:MAG: hypothetical protein ACRC4N_04145 [Gammaproteobacteria bacterium]
MFDSVSDSRSASCERRRPKPSLRLQPGIADASTVPTKGFHGLAANGNLLCVCVCVCVCVLSDNKTRSCEC